MRLADEYLSMGSAFAAAARGALLGTVIAGFALAANAADVTSAVNASVPNQASIAATPTAQRRPGRADFGAETASVDARQLAQWVMHSGDNGGLPFLIIDKVQARVFAFGADGQLRGASTALLGLAIGDDSVPGIGQRPLSSIRAEERTTPAGRFVASLDRDLHGKELLWVDYDTSVSLHIVVPGTPKERRAQRLASPSPLDKRITYGCINVPANFYQTVVSPAFKGTTGIVYVLPETRSAAQVFGSYVVNDSGPASRTAPQQD